MIEEFRLDMVTVKFIDYFNNRYELSEEFRDFLNEHMIVIVINPLGYYYSIFFEDSYFQYKNQKFKLRWDWELDYALLKYRCPFVLDIPKQDILQVKTELLLTWS